MKKKVIGGLSILLSAIFAAGCGNEIPELNEQEQELVVEYAVGTLLKYDKNYETKLVELTLDQELEDAETAVTKEEKKNDDQVNKEDDASISDQEDSMSDVTVIDNTQPQVDATIESFLKLDNIKFTYTGYETDDFYPEQSDEYYFIINATEGNKLLVLKFAAENFSGMETELNIAQSETRFKIVINGEEKNALTTMLLNDMVYYQGVLAPGENKELVLICEIADEQVEMISSLELILKSVDEIATISLN